MMEWEAPKYKSQVSNTASAEAIIYSMKFMNSLTAEKEDCGGGNLKFQ
jgi:hypothetical protein